MAAEVPMEQGADLPLEDNNNISGKLLKLKYLTGSTAEILKEFKGLKEAFTSQSHDRQTLEEQINFRRRNPHLITPESQQLEMDFNARWDSLDSELKQKIHALLRLSNDLDHKLGATLHELSLFKAQVVDEKLTEWKHHQKLWGSSNKNAGKERLDKLQLWCEDFATLISENRNQLKEIELMKQCLAFVPEFLQSNTGTLVMQEELLQLFFNLVASTFVVETQPPQVLRLKTNFTATVRLLLGSYLGIKNNPPEVKVSVLNAAQATALLSPHRGDHASGSSGTFLKSSETMTYCNTKLQLTANFDPLQLTTIQRGPKPTASTKVTVLDEKFCLCFECRFEDEGLNFNIWTLSLPVVVTVHSSQESSGWATIMWDNAFSEPGRMPFQVPAQVPWTLLGQAFSDKFNADNGRGLTQENLSFLAQKAFSKPNVLDDDLLTWNRFCKDNLPGCDFTFWEWLNSAMKLTQDFFPGPWADGLIHGFLGRQQAEAMLSNSPPGTFLLRFSDSVMGTISITWVHPNKRVYSLAPFTSKDLAELSLAKQVTELKQLINIYPGIPKDSAFEKYSRLVTAPKRGVPDGYVGPDRIPRIPDDSSFSLRCKPTLCQFELGLHPLHSINVAKASGSQDFAFTN